MDRGPVEEPLTFDGVPYQPAPLHGIGQIARIMGTSETHAGDRRRPSRDDRVKPDQMDGGDIQARLVSNLCRTPGE